MKLAFAAALLSLAFACRKQPAPAAPPAALSTGGAAAAPQERGAISGKVAETFDASQYTYLRIVNESGELWAAVPRTKKAVGEPVTVVGAIWMQNFKSTATNRTWERIAFGTLEEAAPAQSAAALPPNHPPLSPAAPVGEVKVAKASGAQGRTIADLYARKDQLRDKSVSVRGKVVKATNGVMGRNWLHLRDGTGEGPASDLAVASEDSAQVGDTVVASGKVHLDRDLGAGYHYDLLLEDARVKRE